VTKPAVGHLPSAIDAALGHRLCAPSRRSCAVRRARFVLTPGAGSRTHHSLPTPGTAGRDARHVQGRLLIPEPETAGSGASADPNPAKRLFRDLRAAQADERRRAGSAWQETGFVFTTEVGEPYDPRNALRALQVAAGRAGLPKSRVAPLATHRPA
jgi:hypothetical protein